MKFNGEISNPNEEEDNGRNSQTYSIGPGFPQPQKLVVGYALTLKKKKSFLQPKLEGLARYALNGVGIRGYSLLQLTKTGHFPIKVLSTLFYISYPEGNGTTFLRVLALSLILNHDQIVEVDALRISTSEDIFPSITNLDDLFRCQESLQKVYALDAEDYRQKHPEVTVLDPPDAIQHVHNRQSMLKDVADINLSDCYGKVGVPRQLVIKKDPASIPYAVSKAGLMLPLVAKPLIVDGSAESHELSLAYDQFSLSKLEPPLVLQEFVNHGGVLFKVYIVGETIKVVRRFSLPDVNKCELLHNAGVFQFPRVSCAAASADNANLDPDVAELPPQPLLERLARELRHRLGLHLFNIDIIREHGTRDSFYVIDINYFPGYGKMPEYEHIFTDFLLSLCRASTKSRSLLPVNVEGSLTEQWRS